MQIQQNSFLRRTGQGARREFQAMHLAVFPYKVEYLKNVDFEIIAYFQKGNQIIGVNGDKPINFPRGMKNGINHMNRIQDIILFHVYSEFNVGYKWSLYKRYPNGDEQYLQSCGFNLKQIVINHILPHQNDTLSMISLAENNFYQKQLRGKFGKIGIILNFALVISVDIPMIQSFISKRYCENGRNSKSNQQIIQITNGKIQKVVQQVEISQQSLMSISMLSQSFLLKNESKIQKKTSKKSLPLTNKSKSEKLQYQNQQNYRSQDLDDLILNDTHSNNLQISRKFSKENQEQNQDLKFGVVQAVQLISNNNLFGAKKQFDSEQELKPNVRDYSILRVQSDQNAMKPELIDAKMQLKQLQMIEEQKNEIMNDMDSFSLPFPQQNKKYQNKINNKIQNKPLQSFSYKKIIIYFTILAVIFMIAAAYQYHPKKLKIKSKSKSKSKSK